MKNNAYELSVDYPLLYTLICSGFEIACFVPSHESVPGRTSILVSCFRMSEWNICIGFPGRSFGCIYSFDKENSAGLNEQALFIKMCENIEVKFISP